MAQKSSHKGLMVGVVVVLLIAGIYFYAPDRFSGFNVGGGGVQTPVDNTSTIGSQNYEGSVTVNLVHRDALDSAESRTEGTHLVTTFYKKVGTAYHAIGSGSGNTIQVDSTVDRFYVSVAPVSGQNFYVAPSSTADPVLNTRIKAFDFFDISGDGIKEYVFTTDATKLKIVGGQTSPTIDLYINSYDYSVASLSAPADQTSISTSSGTNVFAEWDITHALIESANAQYEYEIGINSTNTAKWDRGSSTLTIPNVGTVSLADFVESQDGTNTTYKYTLGFSLKDANYEVIPQNVQNKTDVDLKLVANFGSSEAYTVTLTVRSITPSQGTASDADTLTIST